MRREDIDEEERGMFLEVDSDYRDSLRKGQESVTLRRWTA